MYIQQIGRAGRGDQGARATLMINASDTASNVKGLTDEMRGYCNTSECRREYLCKYFGYEISSNASLCCDNCQGTSSVMKQKEATLKFVPEIIVDTIEKNLTRYASIDASLAAKLTEQIIQSIARCCKDLEDYRQICDQYGLQEHQAQSVFAIITAVIQHHDNQ